MRNDEGGNVVGPRSWATGVGVSHRRRSTVAYVQSEQGFTRTLHSTTYTILYAPRCTAWGVSDTLLYRKVQYRVFSGAVSDLSSFFVVVLQYCELTALFSYSNDGTVNKQQTLKARSK